MWQDVSLSTAPMGVSNGSAALVVIAAGAISAWLLRERVPKRRTHAESMDLQPSSAKQNEEVATQMAQMRSVYAGMAQQFLAQGLDPGAILPIVPWFHGVATGAPGAVWPKAYPDMDPPFPPDVVRILVVPLEDCPALASAAAAAAARIATLLPPGTKIFSNARAQYHITVLHTSHPLDTRPDPFAADGGLGVELCAAPPPHERPTPSADVLARERAAIADVVASQPPPILHIHSVVMARSGTLLLTWVDPTGRLVALRQRLLRALPGASSKQATIIHTSLLRVLSPEPLAGTVLQQVDAACVELTSRLRGRALVPRSLWWITETEFSTVVGPRWIMPLASAPAGL